jgi:hypothetical protein
MASLKTWFLFPFAALFAASLAVSQQDYSIQGKVEISVS